MPCNQMITMNIRPPRPIEASSAAIMPKLKARLLNRLMWNIGSSTRVSMITNTTSSAAHFERLLAHAALSSNVE
jgi:hypothetical protein